MFNVKLSQLGLEFWLPLPLIAVCFWAVSGWLNEKILNQTYEPMAQLTTQHQQVALSFRFTVASIDAEIDRSTQTTEVSIQTTGSALKELEFEYPLVEFAEIEQAIARELGLMPDDIQPLIRYRID